MNRANGTRVKIRANDLKVGDVVLMIGYDAEVLTVNKRFRTIEVDFKILKNNHEFPMNFDLAEILPIISPRKI